MTRNFADVIRKKIRDNPELALEVVEQSIKDIAVLARRIKQLEKALRWVRDHTGNNELVSVEQAQADGREWDRVIAKALRGRA